jgi:hypothetical protein
MRTYVSCRTKALLPKVTVRTTSTGFASVQSFFEASRPLAATTNIGVVTRAVDADGHESKYYGVIKNIIEYSFSGNKNMKTVFSTMIGLIPIMVLEKTILVWLKSNTRVDCVVVTHLSLLTRWSRSIICCTHVKS